MPAAPSSFRQRELKQGGRWPVQMVWSHETRKRDRSFNGGGRRTRRNGKKREGTKQQPTSHTINRENREPNTPLLAFPAVQARPEHLPSLLCFSSGGLFLSCFLCCSGSLHSAAEATSGVTWCTVVGFVLGLQVWFTHRGGDAREGYCG